MIIKLVFIILDNGGIIFPLIMPIMAVLYRLMGQKHIHKNPKLKGQYNRLALWFGGVGSIPFIFFAYDVEASAMGVIYNLMEPDFVNFAVIGTWASSIMLDLLFIYWIFFKKGAELLYLHPGICGYFNKIIFYKIAAFFMPMLQITAYLAYHLTA